MIRPKPIPGPLRRTGEPDLVAAWPFTELAGVPADVTGRYDKPVFSSSPPTWQTGLYGAELLFATTQAVQVTPSGTPILAGLANWTIIAIARTASTSDPNGLALYTERGTTGNDLLKLQRADTSTNASLNTFGLIYRDNAGILNRIGSIGVITDDKYHHFAITKAGTAIRLYLDGVFNNSGTLTAGDTMTDATLRGVIGADPSTSTDGWVGPIVGVWLYQRALSDADIARHFANPWFVRRPIYLQAAPPTPPPVDDPSPRAPNPLQMYPILAQ